MSIFTDKCKIYVPRLMTDLSITKVQACGIMGNIGTETGGFTALQEKKPTVKGSRGGYGWMQWTGPRRKKYEEWAKKNNLDIASDETNYRYLVQETLTDEAASLGGLRKTTSLDAATETFMLRNLRPGAPHLDNRRAWANKAWEATNNVAATSAGAVIATGGAAVILTQTPSSHWGLWIAGILVVSIVVGVLVHWYKNRNTKENK